MANPNIERLLREIVKEQEAEEEYLFGHIDQLEQLCRDIWSVYCERANASFHPVWHIDSNLANRMNALGLLEGGSHE